MRVEIIERYRLRFALVSVVLLVQGAASAQAIADFTADYLSGTAAGQTRAARANDGWDYQTNSAGTIGTSSNYTSLTWASGILAYSIDGTALGGTMASGSGRPGRGVAQGTAADRFVIAAYKVQAGENGPIYITNSSISVPIASGSIELRIYVNNTLNGGAILIAGGGAVTTFDRFLGNLVAGDNVYVAVGPNTTNDNDPFNLQFRLERASAPPVISPPAGNVFAPTVQISMNCATPDAVMYYTTDLSTPTSASTPYTAPFPLNASGVVKAIAISPTLGSSLVMSSAYVNVTAPSNDNFANAMQLTGSVPFSKFDDNFAATTELGEPHHAGTAAAKSVWYSWTPAVAGPVTISTAGSSLDTTLAVYTGTGLANLSLVAANADILPLVNKASQVSFAAAAGTAYFIAVDGNNGSEGTFTLAFTPAPQVSVVAIDPTAAEAGLDGGTFQVTRTGSTAAAMTVNYSVGGTAEASVDYLRIEESITFNIGIASVNIPITPIDNNRYNANATVILTLTPPGASGLDPNTTNQISAPAQYAINPANASATVTIVDNDPVATDKAGFVTYSPAHGFYDAPISLIMGSSTPGVEIRYTLDGTVPTAASTLYSTPISISQTSAIRAVAFKAGLNPSKCTSSTYVFVNDVITQSPTGTPPPGWPASWGQQNNFDGQGIRPNKVDYGMDPNIVTNALYAPTIKTDLKSLPVISLVMKLDDLFNPSTNPYVGGIYANSIQEDVLWEKPCSIELFDPNNALAGFQANCGVRIRGGASSLGKVSKHSFRLYFRDEYGGKRLDYPLFGPDPAAQSFQQFDLAAFSQDAWNSYQGNIYGTFLRDVFSHDTHLAMGAVTPRNDYYHLYINGQYWGMIYTDEHVESNFAATYFGGDSDDYDVVKAKNTVVYATAGNADAWNNLWAQCKAGLSTNAAYFKIQGRNPDGSVNPAYENLLDVDALIDFMLVHYYTGNLDGPVSSVLGDGQGNPVVGANNFSGARNRNGSAGFRFFIHDAEFSLGLGTDENENRLGPFPTGDDLVNANPQWMFQQCEANPEFRQLLADHLQKHFFNGGVLTAGACLARFNARKNQIDRGVVAESARWGDARVEPPFNHNSTWQTEINYLVGTYLPARSDIVLNQFRNAIPSLFPSLSAPIFNQFGGPIPPGFMLNISNTNGVGKIYYTLNGADPRKIGGTIQGSDGGTTAINLTLNATTTVRARILNGVTWSALQEATFTTTQDFTKLKVTEIMYNPPDMGIVPSQELEFIELKNTGSVPLNLTGATFTTGITYTFPPSSVINPNQFIVLCANANAFVSKYPAVTPTGAFSGHLSDSGETLTLVHPTGATILTFTYNDALPWPSTPDGLGFSLVPQNTANPGDPNNYLTWRPSALNGGSPGADDPAPLPGKVLINEALTHSNLPLVDYIELFNSGTAPVNIGGWFLTDDRHDPKKFRILDGTQVGNGQYIYFTEGDFNLFPGVPTNFSLSSRGESVFIFAADANGNLTGYSHGFDFGASAPDVSFGRYTISTGEDHFVAQIARTPGQTNTLPRVGPVVINEIMYFPAANGDPFVELLNTSPATVQLFDPAHPENAWRLNGLDFTFPTGIVIPSGGMIVVSSIDPAVFRQKYSVPANVQIFGPFLGLLQTDGETIALERPDTPEIDPLAGTIVPYIVVDAVRYSNTLPWPVEPAGNGPSLSRINPYAYGNDPINWTFSAVSGGTPGIAQPVLPPAPGNPTAVAVSVTQINVAWTDPSSDENGFRVERSPDGVSNWQQVAEFGANTTAFQDVGLSYGTNYYYRIYSFNIFGNSAFSAVATAKTKDATMSPPTGLTVTATTFSHVDLSWADGSPDETNFRIERSPDGLQGWTQTGTVGANVTIFQDVSVTTQTTYYYRVSAFNATDASPYSNVVFTTTPPSAPAALTVAVSAFDHVDLSWTDVSTIEKGFTVERSPDGINGWVPFPSLPPNSAAFQDTTVAEKVTYFYRVFAFNDTGVSPYSNIVSTKTPQEAPAAPTDLAIVLVEFNHIDLSWTDNATTERGFKIERSLDGVGGWVTVGNISGNSTKFQDKSVDSNTTYFYRVFAYNDSVSPYSNIVSAKTHPGPPKTPQTLTATAVSESQINLSWSDVANDELGFRLERSANGVSGWSQIAEFGANVTTAQNSGLSAVTFYFYRIYAFNDLGNSGFSNVASAITFSPSAPDSDGDGYSDAEEIAAGTNPHDPSSKPGGTADFDHDGLLDHLDADADGDGVSNVDEIAAGTDPYNAASYPSTAGQVEKLQCKANFKSVGKDTCKLSGIVPSLAAPFDPTGKPLVVEIGGAVASFTLDAKGKAKNASGTAAVTLKPTIKNAQTHKPEFAGGSVKYSVSLKGAFANSWLDEGFSATPSKDKKRATMNVALHFAGKVYVLPVMGTISKNTAFISDK